MVDPPAVHALQIQIQPLEPLHAVATLDIMAPMEAQHAFHVITFHIHLQMHLHALAAPDTLKIHQFRVFLVQSGGIAFLEAQLHVLQILFPLKDHLHCLHAYAISDTLAPTEACALLVLQIHTTHLADPMHAQAILVTMAPVEAHAPLARLNLTGSTLARELLLPTARFLAMLDTMAPA